MPLDIEYRGRLTVEALAADGSVLWREEVDNAATLEGLTDNLSVQFNAGAQKTQWFLGLISDSGYTGVSTADTMSSHAGWTEFTGYSAGARPQWSPLAAAAAIIANTAEVTYTLSAAGTLRGFFVSSNSTKGGATGTLWATALFATARTLAAGNGLRVTYTVKAVGGTT